METLKLGIEGLDQIELIGRGGSSRVYRARQVDLDRMVALKVLNASDDADVVRRFDRERRAMGRLSENEGIVPVYSTGLTDNGEPYLLMPYYVQGSLQDRLESGPVPWPEAVDYMVAVANTMAAAHRSGVVHLDLKPANILLSSNGSPRIADFGIAKLLEQGGSKTTGAAFTPTFSAPEALLGDMTSPASDVYGLGATLWALIAGRPPFRDLNGDNALMAVVGRVVHQPVASLRDQAPHAVCAVIEQAMAKRPEDRYPTAGTFAQALTEAADEAGRHPRGNGYASSGSDRTRREQAAPAAGGAFASRRPPSQIPDSGPAGAATLARHTAVQPSASNGRLFQDAVPPPFVPVDPNVYDDPTPSRGTVAVLAAGGVILLIVALITVVTLMAGGDGDNGTADTARPTPDAATSTADGAQAGAFGGTAVAGPTTDTTARDQSLVTPTASATTTPPLSDPSSSFDSTSASTATSATITPSSPTSTTTPPTSQTASTTTNTSRPTTNTSTATTSTTSPSSTTTTALEPPADVTADLSADKVDVQVSWTPSTSVGTSGYNVLRTSSTGTTFEMKVQGRTVKSLVDSSVIAGQTYTYKVRATGSGSAVSAYSSPSDPVTVPDTGA
ncbi:MAG: protein kinase [Acidimicrobiales bacterium]